MQNRGEHALRSLAKGQTALGTLTALVGATGGMRRKQAQLWFSLMIVLGLVSAGASAAQPENSARADEPDYARFLPTGYQVDQVVRYAFPRQPRGRYVVAISDHINLEQPLMLLYLKHEGVWRVKEQISIHLGASRDRGAAFEQPNYYWKLSIPSVNLHRLILLQSVFSGGGSGADFVFDFFQIRQDRLVLVQTFHHVRMEQTYFCLDRGVLYDATFHDIKGPKVGRSYVHTYYLDVVKYAFDGTDFAPVGQARLREKQGNWTKADDYRFLSVCKAVRSGEIFGAAKP